MAENYTIVKQEQTQTRTEGGTWTDAMKVTFRTTSGVTGYVDVPLSRYNALSVKSAIDQRVADIMDVEKL